MAAVFPLEIFSLRGGNKILVPHYKNTLGIPQTDIHGEMGERKKNDRITMC